MLSRWFRRQLLAVNGLESLEARSLLSADLAVTVGALGSGFDAYGNPLIKLPVTVVNYGSTPLAGGGSIDYYLSSDRTLDANDFKFTSMALPKTKAFGSTAKVNLNTIKPAIIAPAVGHSIPAGNYFVIAKLNTKPGADVNPSNDQAATLTTLTIDYRFGLINGKDTALTATFADGSVATFRLSNAGVGQVLNVDNRVVVIINGTQNNSELTIKAAGKKTPTIDGLTINGTIKNIYARTINFGGDVTVTGSLKDIELGDVANSTVTVSGFSPGLNVDLRAVSNINFKASASIIENFVVKSWSDTDGVADTLNAAIIEGLKGGSTFHTNVTTLTTDRNGYSIVKVDLGNVTGGVWNIAGGIDTLTVGSFASTWAGNIAGIVNSFYVTGNMSGTLGVTGGVRRLTVCGNLHDGYLLAGANLGSDGMVSVENGDTFAAGHIGVVEIRGSMSNYLVAAGLSTQDDSLFNGDDTLLPNSQIDTIIVKKGISGNSAFAAVNLPKKANVNFRDGTTANDGRFVTHLP